MLQAASWRGERTGSAPYIKPLVRQVKLSPNRVSATRERQQWGQVKSKKCTRVAWRVLNSQPQLVSQGR